MLAEIERLREENDGQLPKPLPPPRGVCVVVHCFSLMPVDWCPCTSQAPDRDTPAHTPCCFALISPDWHPCTSQAPDTDTHPHTCALWYQPQFKPFMLTRDMVKVFGAGYPSQPTMTIEEAAAREHDAGLHQCCKYDVAACGVRLLAWMWLRGEESQAMHSGSADLPCVCVYTFAAQVARHQDAGKGTAGGGHCQGIPRTRRKDVQGPQLGRIQGRYVAVL